MLSNSKRFKILSSALAVTMLASVAVGCGGKTNESKDGAATPAAADKGKKLEISMMYPLYGNPPQKTEVWKLMEEKLNIAFNAMAIPSAQFGDKLQASIAANDLADITHYWSFPDPKLTTYAKQGAFLQLDDLIKDTKTLKNLPKEMWDQIKVDGKIYGVPRPAQLERAVIIRKDWLDALGLAVPKTLDEFYNVAVKFAKADPDKNGKEDTFGIILNQTLNWHLDPVFMAFDTGNSWRKMEDGSLMKSEITPQRKAALEWLSKLYKDGGIDKDFVVMKENQMWEKLESGKAGLFLGGHPNDYNRFVTNLKKIDPKAELAIINPPVGPDGKTGFPFGTGFFGQFILPAKIDKEKAKRAIELLDWQASQEAFMLKKLGIEGVHHTKNADGTAAMTGDKYSQEGVGNIIWNVPNDPFLSVALDAPANIQKAIKDNLTSISKMGVKNPAISYQPSAAVNEKAADLNKMIQETSVKIIVGELPISAFDTFVKEWKAKGGDLMTKEANDFFKTAK